jgi:N-acetylneuraminic acid mutarotase
MRRSVVHPLVESLEGRCLFSAAALGDVALPVVNVTARRAAMYEGGPTTRFFVLRRTGDVTNKLVVQYTVGGKAKAGLDYNDLGSIASFKAGYAIRKIYVTAVDDSIVEANESITLTLNATAAYTVSAAAPAATLRIIDNDTPPALGKLSWTTKAAAPIGRSEAMVAAVGGKMWLFGGYTDGTATASGRVDTYDPATNTWAKVNTTMPLATTHSGCTVIGTDVYLAGGYHGGSGGQQTFASNQVWKYSTTTNTWTRMTDLPDARGGGALVALNGQLHFMGGSDLTRKDRDDHWVLNLAAASPGVPQWTTLASLPTLRNHLGGVALGGKIYIVGGQQNQDAAEVPQAALEVYDPATNKWAALASLPFGRSHIAAATVVWNGHIVTFGGETQYLESINNVSAYDPATNTWSELTTLPGSRSSGAAAVIDGVVYYTGGLLTTTTWKGTLA